jgi:hypothetical protein
MQHNPAAAPPEDVHEEIFDDFDCVILSIAVESLSR